MTLPPIVQRARRWLHVLAYLDRLEPFTMSADRDLITTILAALPAISEGIAAKDAKIAQLQQQLTDAGAAQAADESDDAAALAPVAQAVDAIRTALADSSATPATEPDPIPVEDVPSAVGDATDDGSGSGDTSGPDVQQV